MSNVEDRRDYGTFIPSFLDDFGLDMASFRLYAHIARRAGSGICWESVPAMAKVCQMDRKTAFKAFAFLQDRKMILVERRKGQTSLITLTNHSVWLPVPDKGQVEPIPNQVLPRPKSGTPPVPNQGHPPVPNQGHPPVPNQGHKGTPYEGTPTKEIPLSTKSNFSQTQFDDRISKMQQAERDKWTQSEIDCRALSRQSDFVEYIKTVYLPTVPEYRTAEIEISNAKTWIVKGQRDPARRDLVEIQLEAFETWRSRQQKAKTATQNENNAKPRLLKPNPITWTDEQKTWSYDQWEKYLHEQNTSNASIYANY